MDPTQCWALRKDGEPCSNAACTRADLDRRYCISHQPAEVRRELGFGGPQVGSGRPRVATVTEILNEQARVHADELVAAFRAGLAPEQPAALRVKTAQTWLRASHNQQVLELRREQGMEPKSPTARRDELAQLPADQLVLMLASKLARLERAGVISSPRELTGSGNGVDELVKTIDGQAVEIEREPTA
jgi:hypothetical protein